MRDHPKSKPDQQRRLSAALRENLKRRKAQTKRRAAAGPAETHKPHDSAGIPADKDAAGPR